MISFVLPLSILITLAAPAAGAVESSAEPPAADPPTDPRGHTGPDAVETSTPPTAVGTSGQPVAAETSTQPATVETSDEAFVGLRTEPVAPTPAPAPEVAPAPAPAPAPDVEAVVEDKPAGPVWTPGAHMFLRSEGRINPDFDGSRNTAPDVVKVLERARLQLGGVWGPVGVFVQAQDARVWGFEGSTISNEANTDLHQGWLELKGGIGERELSGSVRAGRQEINWGSQRLIGALGWAPTARSFDALRFQGQAGRFRADAFVAVLAPPSEFNYTDAMDVVQVAQTRGNQLAGGLLAFAAHKAINIEAMVLSDFADASLTAPTRDRAVIDFGARLWGKPFGGLSYEAEGHAQVGHDGAADHRAWAWAAHLAYLQGKGRVKPGVKLGYAMASGSRCGGGYDPAGDCGSSDFFNFYPTNHMHYGLVDLIGWRNMRNLELKGSVAVDWFKMSLAYHFLQMQSPTGRWSDVGGKSVGIGFDPNNVDRTLGHEFDLVAVLKPWKPLMIQPGYGLFLPRKAGTLLGGADPQHFLYLWLVTNF